MAMAWNLAAAILNVVCCALNVHERHWGWAVFHAGFFLISLTAAAVLSVTG